MGTATACAWQGRVSLAPQADRHMHTAPHLHGSHLQVHRRDFGDNNCQGKTDGWRSHAGVQPGLLQTSCPHNSGAQQSSEHPPAALGHTAFIESIE